MFVIVGYNRAKPMETPFGKCDLRLAYKRHITAISMWFERCLRRSIASQAPKQTKKHATTHLCTTSSNSTTKGTYLTEGGMSTSDRRILRENHEEMMMWRKFEVLDFSSNWRLS